MAPTDLRAEKTLAHVNATNRHPGFPLCADDFMAGIERSKKSEN